MAMYSGMRTGIKIHGHHCQHFEIDKQHQQVRQGDLASGGHFHHFLDARNQRSDGDDDQATVLDELENLSTRFLRFVHHAAKNIMSV